MAHSATDKDSPGLQWTSWEGYNFVLKGLVDELISLGACPELKQITLQLWAKYLGLLEVAFTSKSRQLLPKFGIHQLSKDYAIVSEHIKEKQRSLKKLLNAKPSTYEPLFSELHYKRGTENQIKIGTNVYLDVDREVVMAELASARATMREIDYRIKVIDNTNAARKAKMAAESAAEEHITFNQRTQEILAKMVVNHEKNSTTDLKFETCFDPVFLSNAMVLSVLCVAMFYTKDGIQISDIIRWIREGHLSYFNLPRLFPESIKMTYVDRLFIRPPTRLRYKSLQRCMFHVSSLLGVEVWPAPDLVALTRRFVLELQLPSEMCDYVERLMAAFRVDQCERMMHYEAVVMSFIIVVLKTFFGLDGRTEHKISKFAVKVNSLMDNVENVHLGSRLFVWDDWVHYIECRKSFIANKHFSSKRQIEMDLSTDTGPYSHHCTKEQIKNLKMAKIKLHRSFRRHKRIFFRNAVAQLPTWKKIKRAYNFPPSLTPHVSYLEEILSCRGASKNKLGSVPHMDILTYDHTTTSLEFLIQPNKIKEFAKSRGVDVVIKESTEHRKPESINIIGKPTTSLSIGANYFKDKIYPIREDVGNQSEAQRLQRPPDVTSKKTARKRKRSCYTKENNDDVESFSKKENRREVENMRASCSKDGYNNRYEGKHASKRRQIKENATSTSSTVHDTLTLHVPFSAYWVYKCHPNQREMAFERKVEPDLSVSFRWLLRECARLLELKSVDLYSVLRQVEDLCAGDAVSTVLQLRFFQKKPYFKV